MGQVVEFKRRLTTAEAAKADFLSKAAKSIECEDAELLPDDRSMRARFAVNVRGNRVTFTTHVPGGLPMARWHLSYVARDTASILSSQVASKGHPDPEHFDREVAVAGSRLEQALLPGYDIGDGARMRVLTRAAESLHARELARALSAVASVQREFVAEQARTQA